MFISFKWIGRQLDGRKIKKKMYTEKSRDSKEDSAELTFKEVDAKKPLTFAQFNANSIPEQAVQSRKKAIKEVVRIFDYSSLLSIIAASGYLFVHYFMEPGDLDASLITGYFLIFATILGHLVYRKGDLNADSGGFTNFGKAIIRIVPQISIVSPAGRVFALKILMLWCLLDAVSNLMSYRELYGIGLLIALGLHIFLLVRFHSKTRHKHNNKLLILRVFGINKAALFTFDKLQRYWQHYGSVFTVVDPSFMKNKYKDNNTNLIIQIPFIVIGLFFAWITAQEIYNVDLMDYGNLILGFAVLIGILYLRYRLYKVETNFLRNRQDLHKRIERLYQWPRKWNQSFKQLPLMCYANTWFIAVTEFIVQSKIILMDLRGLSVEKIGCEAEISYLLDAVALEKIVFLANESDIALVQKVINKNWEMLRDNSPNLNLERPEIKIFVASQESLEDVQGLMDIMLDISGTTENL